MADPERLVATKPTTSYLMQTANALEVEAAVLFDRAKALPTKHYLQREKREAMFGAAVDRKMQELAFRELIDGRQKHLRAIVQTFPDAPGHIPGRDSRMVNMLENFVGGAQACREMMARFVEQGGHPEIAQSIRLNWNPSWGSDPGPPIPALHPTGRKT